MKKLSVLIAMILCVTIGGVYATWTYAGDKVSDFKYEAVVKLTAAETKGSYGTYKIDSNLKVFIDQKSKSPADFSAVLQIASADTNAPYLKVTFTPDTSYATPEIISGGLASKLTFSALNPMQVKVRKVTDSAADRQIPVGKWIVDEVNGTLTNILTFAEPDTITWTKESDGTFTYTLDEAALKTRITLTEDFYLPTKAEYDVFESGLVSNISVVVSDAHTATN